MIAPFNENTVIFSPEESPDKCIFPFDTVTLKELFSDLSIAEVPLFTFSDFSPRLPASLTAWMQYSSLSLLAASV